MTTLHESLGPAHAATSVVDADTLLEEAERFVWAGDPLEALARARQMQGAIGAGADASTRARFARTIRRYEALAKEWQAANAARSVAYLTREQKAIAWKTPDPVEGDSTWYRAMAWLRKSG